MVSLLDYTTDESTESVPKKANKLIQSEGVLAIF